MAENKRYPSYLSHFPILSAVVANSTGPVLELGCGDGSTPMLHEICRPTERMLLTVESDRAWMAKFTHLAQPWHEFRIIGHDTWPTQGFENQQPWGVAFIDHGNGDQRHNNLEDFACVDYPVWVVIHDAGGVEHYKLGAGLKMYKHIYKFTDYWPHTYVCSNHKAWK